MWIDGTEEDLLSAENRRNTQSLQRTGTIDDLDLLGIQSNWYNELERMPAQTH